MKKYAKILLRKHGVYKFMIEYKEFDLQSSAKEKIKTEIMYEIASARADNAEFVRININLGDQSAENRKSVSATINTLKDMKKDRRIQFFATEDNFKHMSTEAIFLLNKYPDHFENMKKDMEEETFIYAKI